MKKKLCFKCEKNFVPSDKTILWCDECRGILNLPMDEIKPLPPIILPKLIIPKKDEIDAWEEISFPTDKDPWFRAKYWNGLRLLITSSELSADPEYWATIRDIRIILQRFRGKKK